MFVLTLCVFSHPAPAQPTYDPALAQDGLPILDVASPAASSHAPRSPGRASSPTSDSLFFRPQYDTHAEHDFVPAQRLVPMCVRRPQLDADGSGLESGDIVPTTCLLSHGANGVSVLDMHPNHVVTKFHITTLGEVIDACTSEPGAVGSNTVFVRGVVACAWRRGSSR